MTETRSLPIVDLSVGIEGIDDLLADLRAALGPASPGGQDARGVT